jgi:hypothetical protein
MVPSNLERKGRSSFKVISAEVAVVLLCGSTINQPGCWKNRVFLLGALLTGKGDRLMIIFVNLSESKTCGG